MGVRVLEGIDGYKCLYCSTTMWAFGPIFYEEDDVDDFLEWYPGDPRLADDKVLENRVWEWRKKVEAEGLKGSGSSIDNDDISEQTGAGAAGATTTATFQPPVGPAGSPSKSGSFPGGNLKRKKTKAIRRDPPRIQEAIKFSNRVKRSSMKEK